MTTARAWEGIKAGHSLLGGAFSTGRAVGRQPHTTSQRRTSRSVFERNTPAVASATSSGHLSLEDPTWRCEEEVELSDSGGIGTGARSGVGGGPGPEWPSDSIADQSAMQSQDGPQTEPSIDRSCRRGSRSLKESTNPSFVEITPEDLAFNEALEHVEILEDAGARAPTGSVGSGGDCAISGMPNAPVPRCPSHACLQDGAAVW